MKLCDEVELALSCEDELTPVQASHLAGCSACQRHQREAKEVVTAMRWPSVQPVDARAIESQIRLSAVRPPSLIAVVARYALAAGLGALVTATVLGRTSGRETAAPIGPPVVVSSLESQAVAADFDEAEFGWFDDDDLLAER